MLEQIVALDRHGHYPREQLFARLRELYPAIKPGTAELVEAFYLGLREHVALAEDAQELLCHLEATNVPFGIATNGSAQQWLKIQSLGLDQRTPCIFISDVFGARKPEAAIFLGAAAALRASPTDVLFVGDNPEADIAGAHRVGMRTAWLRRWSEWPAHLPSECADFTISSLRDLIPILAGSAE